MNLQKRIEVIQLPASKSLANRWLVLNYMLGNPFHLEGTGNAGDTVELQRALEGLSHNNSSENPIEIFAGEGGTGFRFLLALLSCKPGEFFLYGGKQILGRPHLPLIEALQFLGSDIQKIRFREKEGYLIKGGPWKRKHLEFKESISSQYLSAIALAASQQQEVFSLVIPEVLPSKPYFEMTLDCLTSAGIIINSKANEIQISRPPVILEKTINIEKDWSAAAFFFALAAGRKDLQFGLPGLNLNSLQSDKAIIEMAQYWGVQAEKTPEGIMISYYGEEDNQGIKEFDFMNCPDLFPACLTACIIRGKSLKASGVQHLVHKESNRLEAMKKIALPFGFHWEEGNNHIRLTAPEKLPDLPQTIRISSFHDHRIAMCGWILKLSFPDLSIEIDDSECIKKSFPNFLEVLSGIADGIIRK